MTMNTSASYEAAFKAGQSALAKGRYTQAVEVLRQAAAEKPDSYQALRALSKAYYHNGDVLAALEAFNKSEACDPLKAEFVQVQQAMKNRDFEIAQDLSKAMVETVPGHPAATYTLAYLHAIQGRHEDRAELLRQALELAPVDVKLRRLYVKALEDESRFAKAVAEARRVVDIDPSFVNLWTLMGILLRHGFYEDILTFSKQAYARCGGNREKQSEIDLLRGQALKILGRRGDSEEALQTCLKNNPQGGAAWWALADMKNYQFSGADIKTMQALCTDISRRPEDRVQAGFALAKAFELKEDYSASMAQYHAANRLRGSRGFDSSRYASAIGALITAWTPEALSKRADDVSHDITPIFIIGMPRSGSTLIEQILASHSQIQGTMETMVLPSVKRRAHRLCELKHSKSYLDGIGDLTPRELSSLGQDYLDGTALYRGGLQPYMIDKLPNNFEHVGLIHKILPQAKIIDMRRNPMDCGYSLYKQYFHAGVDYSYDLTHIGTYYNGYMRLMDHWQGALPEAVYYLSYESIIDDLEGQLRPLLSYMGLEFEESCLRFYNTQRAVRTASSEQVRQPLYKKSVGAWRVVEGELDSLKQSLGDSTLARFEPN